LDSKGVNINDATRFWYPLDNAAKIYPAIMNEEVTAVFRITVVLKHPVRIEPFMKALSIAEKRFPYFRVKLKKGFFWYYLEQTSLHIPVKADDTMPCRSFGTKGLLIRLLVAQNRISAEFSHVLTDGTGALEFLRTLLILYFQKSGISLPAGFKCVNPDDTLLEEEYEDSFNRYFQEDIPPMFKRSKAFHLPFQLQTAPRFTTRQVFLSLEDIRNQAAGKGVSINDYLVSVYLFVLQEIYKETGILSRFKRYKTIRIQVPVNLRNLFPSVTMRNFSLFVMPEIDLRLGHYTFDEIIKTVYHQIRLETDEKLINKNISKNVGSEKKIYVRSMPLFLKSLILRQKYYSRGVSQYSGVVTNMGKPTFPPEMENMIDYFVFTPPPPNRMLKISCGIIGFRDSLVLSFGNISKSTVLEDKFLKYLRDQGIETHYDNNKLVDK